MWPAGKWAAHYRAQQENAYHARPFQSLEEVIRAIQGDAMQAGREAGFAEARQRSVAAIQALHDYWFRDCDAYGCGAAKDCIVAISKLECPPSADGSGAAAAKDWDPFTTIVEGDFNGPHGPTPADGSEGSDGE
jgi:hypothetical protein